MSIGETQDSATSKYRRPILGPASPVGLRTLFEDILATYGYLGIFLVSLGVNLLPFSSPSNMVLAGAIMFLLPTMNPFLVGLSVAFSASIAKTGHYYIASYLGSKAQSKTQKLQSYGKRVGRWGVLAVFLAAATPIPDDPVVIPLGLARYSPIRFFVAYLLGKVLVSVGGAYLGQRAAVTFENLFPTNAYAVLTIVLSIVLVAVLIKADLPAIATKLRKKWRMTTQVRGDERESVTTD